MQLTAFMPQMTVVFPIFTSAEPSAVLMEPEKETDGHKQCFFLFVKQSMVKVKKRHKVRKV